MLLGPKAVNFRGNFSPEIERVNLFNFLKVCKAILEFIKFDANLLLNCGDYLSYWHKTIPFLNTNYNVLQKEK